MITSPDEKLNCALADRCSGCDLIHLDRGQLEADRRSVLRSLGLKVEPHFVWIAPGGLRDRLEFTFDGGPLGLFARGPEKTLLDIDRCPQLSTNLQNWLTEFRRDLPPLNRRGTIRLRVAPSRAGSHLRGVWLDLANEEIRDLLDEADWLSRQLAGGIIVEVGQKRKRVVADTNPETRRAHRLEDAVLENWFDVQTLPLFAAIGTFTQPGFLSTDVLVEEVLRMLDDTRPPHQVRIAEFGCGIGTFTLPLLQRGAHVDVFESDRLALAALERSRLTAGIDPALLTVHAGDFILSKTAAENLQASDIRYDLVLVDPPRSGLGRFIESMTARPGTQAASWIYVSCFPESFARDTVELEKRGLVLKKLSVVEQFPFTRHFEIVARFDRLHLK